MSAVLGIFQEKLYSKFGKHSREAMFFSVSLLSCVCSVCEWTLLTGDIYGVCGVCLVYSLLSTY